MTASERHDQHDRHERVDVLGSASADETVHRWGGPTRWWRASGRSVRVLGAALTLVAAAAAAALVVSGVPLDGAAPAARGGSSEPVPRGSQGRAAVPAASPLPSPTAVPVRVPPLCDLDTEFDMPDEPSMDGPPGCPASTRAGWYASTAFVGNSSLLPFTFTLPAGWRVVPVGHILAVDLRTRGRTVVTIVSFPVAYGRMRPVPPERLLRRLGRTPGLSVTGRLLGEPDWWWQAEVTASTNGVPSACGRGPSCVPVLASGYDYRQHPHAVGVRLGGRARLLLHAVTGAPVAVWVWDVGDPSDPVTREALAVVDSLELYPTRPWKPYGSAN